MFYLVHLHLAARFSYLIRLCETKELAVDRTEIRNRLLPSANYGCTRRKCILLP